MMSDYSSILRLMDKHAPKRENLPSPKTIREALEQAKPAQPPKVILPDPEVIRLAAAKAHIGRRKRIPESIVQTVFNKYLSLKSLRALGKMFGVSHTGLSKMLIRRGLNRPRPKRESIMHGGDRFCFDGRYFINQRRGNPSRMLHRVLWSERHGPIPNGYQLVFLSRNYRDFSDSNLAIFPMREAISMIRRARWAE